MIDIRSLLMPISRPGLFPDKPLLFISFCQPISEDFVSRLLKTNKAFGLDKISARLLKDSVDVITPLTNLQINIVNYLHECECEMLETSIGIMSTVGNVDRYKGMSADIHVDRLTIDIRPTLDRVSVDCRPSVDRVATQCRSSVDRCVDRYVDRYGSRYSGRHYLQ